MNVQYWMPGADIFVRPLLAQNENPRGLQIVMIDPVVNWKAKMELIAEEEDEGLPDLI